MTASKDEAGTAIAEKASNYKKYMVHTSSYRQLPFGRVGMPVCRSTDSETYNKLKKLELENKLGKHPEYGNKFPSDTVPTVEALLVKVPSLQRDIQHEMLEAARAEGRIADSKGRFHIESEEILFEVLETLIPLDASLGLQFPFGEEIYLDSSSPKPNKARCMEIRKKAKMRDDAKRGIVPEHSDEDDWS